MFRVVSFILLCLIGSPLLADDAESAVRQQRLAAMRQRAEALRLKIGEKPELRRVGKEPLLRYSDPTRTTTDGTMWLWTQAERPVAVLCLFNDPREGFQWSYELASLSDSALFVDGRPGWNWRPVAKPRSWILVSEPKPADSELARLLQMKTLLSQFRAEEDQDGDVSQLRLLPRPVYRYRCPDEKIEDGAIFVLAYGTNPEVLVQVEVLADEDRSWRVGFARTSAAHLKVTRGDQTVWAAERPYQFNPQHDYFSEFGPDRAKFDQEKE